MKTGYEDAALYHVHELLVESFLNNIVVAERLIVQYLNLVLLDQI